MYLCSLAPTPQVLDVEDVERALPDELLRFFPLYFLLERDHRKEAIACCGHWGKLGMVLAHPLAAVHLRYGSVCTVPRKINRPDTNLRVRT